MLTLDIDYPAPGSSPLNNYDASFAERPAVLASMLTNLPGAVFRSSADDHWAIEFISDGIEDITGYTADLFREAGGLTLVSITHSDDLDRVQEEVAEAVSNDRPYKIEYRVNHATGQTKWVAEHGRAIRDAAGKFQHVDGTIFDVTERRQAEATMQESENRFRSLVTNIPGAFYRADLDSGTVAFMSGGIEAITGRPASFFEGTEIQVGWPFVYPDDAPLIEEAVGKSLEDRQSYAVEYRIHHSDGSTRWLSEYGRPFADPATGTLVWLDGFVFDVTDQKGAEEKLRESEVRFRTIVENLLGAVYQTDDQENTTMDYLSDGIEELTGFEPQELVRNPDRTYEMQIHPDDIELVLLKVKQNFENHEPLYMEYRVLHKDGSVRWVLERGQYYNRGNDNGRQLCGVLIDVTEKKEAGCTLESHRVRLIGQALELERNNAELDSFAYIASHDLKEPLRGIANYSSFLIEDYEDRLDEDGKAKLLTLVRLSGRMESLLDALLAYSRLGREELELERVPLDEVIAEIRENLAALLSERTAEIRVRGPLPVLAASRERITEVFQNLVSNGIKYNASPQRIVEIGVAAKRPESSPSEVPDEAVVCYVRDNGIGIPEKYRDSVFAIFKRLHGRDEYGGGTGARLTIVKKIIVTAQVADGRAAG